jgi:hypothetical protein
MSVPNSKLVYVLTTDDGTNTGEDDEGVASITRIIKILSDAGFIIRRAHPELFSVKREILGMKILNTANIDSLTDASYKRVTDVLDRNRGFLLNRVDSFTPLKAHLSKLYFDHLSHFSFFQKTQRVDAAVKFADVIKSLPPNDYVIKLPFSSTSQGVYISKRGSGKGTQEFLDAELKGRPYYFVQEFFRQVAELRVFYVNGALRSIVVTKLMSTGLTAEEAEKEKDSDRLVMAEGSLLKEGTLELTPYTFDQAIAAEIVVNPQAVINELQSCIRAIMTSLAINEKEFIGIGTWPLVRFDFFIDKPEEGKQEIRFNELELGSSDLYPSNNPGINEAVAHAIMARLA